MHSPNLSKLAIEKLPAVNSYAILLHPVKKSFL
jgi:hypothetical protein